MTFNFFPPPVLVKDSLRYLSLWEGEGYLSVTGLWGDWHKKTDESFLPNELPLLFKHPVLWVAMMDVGTNANVAFQALSSLVKQAHLVVFSCQRCTLSCSPPSRLSADPLVLPSAEVAGGWKQANWDQSLSHCHYQFCLDNWSAFFFFFLLSPQ